MNTQESHQPERRSSKRQKVQIFVAKPGGEFVERFGRVNANGFYFETERKLNMGEKIQARFTLHGLGLEINVQGEVVFLSSDEEHAEVGVKFLDLTEEAQQNLNRWLEMIAQATSQT